MTEQEIADRLGTSIATVSRFWRAVGYDNAKAFKLSAGVLGFDACGETGKDDIPAGRVQFAGENAGAGEATSAGYDRADPSR